MNGGIDVIEVLQRVNPVQPGTIDESARPTAAEMRASLPAPSTTVPTISLAEPATHRRRRWPKYAAAAAAVAASIAVFSLLPRTEDPVEPAATTEISTPPPAGPFVGVWLSTDTDGSSQTMEIVRSGGDDYEFVLRDEFATACSGAPATMTGVGLLETDARLVIAQPELTCDDGTIPRIGPPPQAELADLTLEHTATDEFVDSFGVVWRRAGSNDEPIAPSPVTVPAVTSPTSGGMWPQSTLDEVRAAQELADAGDPAYTWQLDAKLAADEEPWGAEIFARFIEEELGWDEFISGFAGQGYLSMGVGGGVYEGVVFIRCAPGQTNPLNPLYADAPPEIRGCAPTIDELTYETVEFSVTQPERRGPSGIWVVERWEMPQSKFDPGSLFSLLYPEFEQVQQVAPPSDAEVTAVLQAFLRARVNGAGAEQYLLHEPEGSPFEDTEVPLLYATTSGAPYERSEIERLQGPVWPNGWTEYKVRLFAEGGTVVEQLFYVVRDDGQLGLVYGYVGYDEDLPTTENGQSVPVPFRLLDGEVTFATAPPWRDSMHDAPSEISDTFMRFTGGRDVHVVIGTDPPPVGTDCENGSAPADAEALARSIMADANLETAGTVPVAIAGIDGLQIDVENAGLWLEGNPCWAGWGADQIPGRMRLYLIDYPGESAQVLTIAVSAPETDFERVLEQATPIVESLEFHPG